MNKGLNALSLKLDTIDQHRNPISYKNEDNTT